MSLMTSYWRGWSEIQLASYQQDQGSSNHCAKFAAASVLNMLYGSSLSGEELVTWLESRPLKGTGQYTIWGNQNGSLVFQTANLIRKLAALNGQRPHVRCGFGTFSDLQAGLSDGIHATLVSVTYFQGKEPVIARGTNTRSSLGSSPLVGGHIMILAAYDSAHLNAAGGKTPWGFLSSWASTENIYWMTERDFHRSWGLLSYYNIITVRK